MPWHTIADDLPQQPSDASRFVRDAKAKIAGRQDVVLEPVHGRSHR